MRSVTGLALVELLISAVIVTILLGVITRGLMSSGDVVNIVVSKNALIEDARFAGNIMTDSLSRAVYIYKKNTVIKLPDSYTTRSPADGSSTWAVGAEGAPLLAFVEGAEDGSLKCKDDARGCMTFVAYYPVKRSVVVANATGADELFDDTRNADAWVLFEYRETLPADNFGQFSLNASDNRTLTNPPTTFSGGKGRFLTDYVVPGSEGFALDFVRCDGSCGSVPAGTTSALYLDGVRNGYFTLAARVMQQRGTVDTPTLRFAIAPRN